MPHLLGDPGVGPVRHDVQHARRIADLRRFRGAPLSGAGPASGSRTLSAFGAQT